MKIGVEKIILSLFSLWMSSCCIETIQDCGPCTPPVPYESAESKKWVTIREENFYQFFINERSSADTISLFCTYHVRDTCIGEPGCCTDYQITSSQYQSIIDQNSIQIKAESIRDVVDLTAGKGTFKETFLCRLYADTLVLVPHSWLTTRFFRDTLIDTTLVQMISIYQPFDTIPFQGIKAIDWIKGRGIYRLHLANDKVYKSL